MSNFFTYLITAWIEQRYKHVAITIYLYRTVNVSKIIVHINDQLGTHVYF